MHDLVRTVGAADMRAGEPPVALGVARQQALVEQQNSDRTSCCARVAWNIWERLGTQGNPRFFVVALLQRRFAWRTPPGDVRKARFY